MKKLDYGTKRNEDHRPVKQWQYSHYQGADESEFLIHFYLKYVFFSLEMNIDEFIDYVRNRISRAAAPQFVRIVQYNKKYKEVKLAVGTGLTQA